MDLSGVAAISLLTALACPLLMVLAVVGRWLPWRQWVTRVHNRVPRRV
jgi:hypothetical protein